MFLSMYVNVYSLVMRCPSLWFCIVYLTYGHCTPLIGSPKKKKKKKKDQLVEHRTGNAKVTGSFPVEKP